MNDDTDKRTGKGRNKRTKMRDYSGRVGKKEKVASKDQMRDINVVKGRTVDGGGMAAAV